MKEEVQCCVHFLATLIKTRIKNVEEEKLRKFMDRLEIYLTERYRVHWFVESPLRGSAFRCIHLSETFDPAVARALTDAGISMEDLQPLPDELSVWVDPEEVAYRFGDHGAVNVLYRPSELKSSYQPAVDQIQHFITCREEVRRQKTSSPFRHRRSPIDIQSPPRVLSWYAPPQSSSVHLYT